MSVLVITKRQHATSTEILDTYRRQSIIGLQTISGENGTPSERPRTNGPRQNGPDKWARQNGPDKTALVKMASTKQPRHFGPVITAPVISTPVISAPVKSAA